MTGQWIKKTMSKRKSHQSSVADYFKKKLVITENENDDDSDNLTSDAEQSKRHVLIDLSIEQVKCDIGINWMILNHFDIRFTGTGSHEVELESEVESLAAGYSTTTSQKKNTPVTGECRFVLFFYDVIENINELIH